MKKKQITVTQLAKMGGNALKEKVKDDPNYYKRLGRKSAKIRWGEKKKGIVAV